MDINRIDPREKVKLVREAFARTFENPEPGVKIPDSSNCEEVFDFFIERMGVANGCSCAKHVGLNVMFTAMAVMIHDVMSRTDLEWSDKQKSEISRMLFSISSLVLGIISTVYSETSDLWKKRIAMMLMTLAKVPADTLEEIICYLEGVYRKSTDEPTGEESD